MRALGSSLLEKQIWHAARYSVNASVQRSAVPLLLKAPKSVDITNRVYISPLVAYLARDEGGVMAAFSRKLAWTYYVLQNLPVIQIVRHPKCWCGRRDNSQLSVNSE